MGEDIGGSEEPVQRGGGGYSSGWEAGSGIDGEKITSLLACREFYRLSSQPPPLGTKTLTALPLPHHLVRSLPH